METNNKDRVCVIAPQSLSSSTVEMVILPVCEDLASRGMSISMVLLHHDIERMKEESIKLPSGINVYYAGQMMVKKTGDYKEYMPLPKLIVSFVKSTIGMLKRVLHEKYDVLLVVKPQPHMVIISGIARLVKRKPLILFSDDLEPESNKLPSNFLKYVFRLSDVVGAKMANKIIVNTTFLYNHYKKYTSEGKIERIYHGIRPERYRSSAESALGLRRKLGIPEHDKVILYAGSIDKASGHRVDILVDAFRLLKNKENNWLVIAGSGDLEYIQELRSGNDSDRQMIFTGRFSLNEMGDYMNMADIVVDPVDDSLVNKAKWSSRILLAKVFGKPVITSDVGDRREWLGEGGLLVDTNSAESLAEGIDWILRNDAEATKMGKAGLESLQYYLWDKSVSKYEIILNKVMSKSSR